MRPSLLLLAGWAHPAGALAAPAKRLAACFEVQCVSPHELRGPDYAQALLALLEQQSSPLVLAGWSMGGMLALQAAARMPGRISRLALISSTARFCSAPDYPCGAGNDELDSLRTGLRHAPERAMKRFFERMCRPEPSDRANRKKFVSESLRFGIPELDRGLAYLAVTDLRSELDCVKVPTLLVHGEADAVIPPAASEYLSTRLPSSILFAVENSGHDIFTRKACEVAQAICDFAQ